MYVVTVLFEVASERWGAFLPTVRRQARLSLAREDGCLRFDVCLAEDAGQVFLYEIYRDRAAFDAHLETAHFREFDAHVAPWVTRKSVATFVLADAEAPE